MKQRLIKFLKNTELFSKNQFGFRTGLTTKYALINFMNEVYGWLECRIMCRRAILKHKKTFDTVDHKALLQKLYLCYVVFGEIPINGLKAT